MKIHWKNLRLYNGVQKVDPVDALADLHSFRKNRTWPKKPETNFLKNGYSWENPADPFTWGPKNPMRDVEWDGFEQAYEAWKAAPR